MSPNPSVLVPKPYETLISSLKESTGALAASQDARLKSLQEDHQAVAAQMQDTLTLASKTAQRLREVYSGCDAAIAPLVRPIGDSWGCASRSSPAYYRLDEALQDYNDGRKFIAEVDGVNARIKAISLKPVASRPREMASLRAMVANWSEAPDKLTSRIIPRIHDSVKAINLLEGRETTAPAHTTTVTQMFHQSNDYPATYEVSSNV